MINPDDKLHGARIRAASRLAEQRFALELRDACASTNSTILELAPPAPGVLQLLACESQTAGRGRRGRNWLSWGGGSLTFSARWQFRSGNAAPAGLSLAAGVAVALALETLGARGIALKWPNDILLHGAKLGGILTELATDSSGAMSAVIGIGLNLRRSDACVPDVPIAALEDALRPVPDRSVLLGACAGQLAAMLETFASAGFAAYRQAWQARNAHVGCMVRVSGEMGAGREGLCVGVDDDGALLIETHGQAMRILSGDVTLRPA